MMQKLLIGEMRVNLNYAVIPANKDFRERHDVPCKILTHFETDMVSVIKCYYCVSLC